MSAALFLFLLCSLASWILLTNATASAYRSAQVHMLEQEYVSATSAARDAMLCIEDQNVLSMVCLQCADSSGSVLTITMEADRLPPAVCEVTFDTDFNLTATVKTQSLTLLLHMPATNPGNIGWSKETALIEEADRRAPT